MCPNAHTHTYTHSQHNAPYIDSHTRYCAYEGGTQYSPLCLALHLNVCFKIDLPKRQTRLYTAKNISPRTDGQNTTLLHGAEYFLES